MSRRNITFYQKKHIGISIILIICMLAILVPVLLAVMNSFKATNDIQQSVLTIRPDMLTFAAYDSVITVLRVWEGLRNNIIIMGISLTLIVAFSSLMAFAIAVVNTKALRRIYYFMIALICVPIYSVMLQLVPLLKFIGLLNTYFGTSFMFTAIALPVSTFLYTGIMRTIPIELSEAAAVEGCGLWHIYFSIYMPLMKAITGTVIILQSTSIWNNLLVSIITLTDPTKSMLVPRMYTFNSSTYTRWELVLASSVLLSVPVTVLYLCMQRVFIRGMVAGAVKG